MHSLFSEMLLWSAAAAASRNQKRKKHYHWWGVYKTGREREQV